MFFFFTMALFTNVVATFVHKKAVFRDLTVTARCIVGCIDAFGTVICNYFIKYLLNINISC